MNLFFKKDVYSCVFHQISEQFTLFLQIFFFLLYFWYSRSCVNELDKESASWEEGVFYSQSACPPTDLEVAAQASRPEQGGSSFLWAGEPGISKVGHSLGHGMFVLNKIRLAGI